MAIDDLEFDALLKQFELEDSSASPITKIVVNLAGVLPLKWPFDRVIREIKGHLSLGSVMRIRLLVEACMNEIRKHDEQIQKLRGSTSTDERNRREETAVELLLDAARKAEATREKERVKRIGLILANAVLESKTTDADETEEMMRIAMELSDNDIKFLKELMTVEGNLLQTQNHIPRYDAHVRWEQGFWRDRIDPEIDSVFSKLESYGLVARLAPPNNLTILADYQNRYVLLQKGVRFASLIREAAK